MSLRRVLLSVALPSLVLLSACTLRPRYKDMVQPSGSTQAVADGQVLMMRVVEPSTGKPISGAKVLAGTGRARVSATSDSEGRLSVLMSQALLEENPLVEVVLPKGAKQYQFQIVRPAETSAPKEPSAPAETPAAEPSTSQPAETPAGTGSPSPTSPETSTPQPPPSAPNPGT
jgi:hypothetical protein